MFSVLPLVTGVLVDIPCWSNGKDLPPAREKSTPCELSTTPEILLGHVYRIACSTESGAAAAGGGMKFGILRIHKLTVPTQIISYFIQASQKSTLYPLGAPGIGVTMKWIGMI